MDKVYSVSDVNNYLKSLFSNDILLNSIMIAGEISNLKTDSRGHMYFTLKDKDSQLSAVMFRGNIINSKMNFKPVSGDKVTASGYIGVYEKTGRYQLYVSELKKEGQGDLYEKFLKLKKELEETGMFDPSYKIPVKKYNLNIGIVTASTGSVIQDIINITQRRNPYVQLILYPAIVQGNDSADSLVKGIRYFNEHPVDVIIIGRGGGSLEDLWSFNEEKVARAVFDSVIPVISAVGHETDYTICDLAADLRAPTPSAAAELAVFDINEYYEMLNAFETALKRPLYHKAEMIGERLERSLKTLKLLSPVKILNDRRLAISGYEEKFKRSIKDHLKACRDNLASYGSQIDSGIKEHVKAVEYKTSMLIERFKALSPFDRLKQGFSFIQDENDAKINSVEDVDIGSLLKIRVLDGTIMSKVESKRKTDV